MIVKTTKSNDVQSHRPYGLTLISPFFGAIQQKPTFFSFMLILLLSCENKDDIEPEPVTVYVAEQCYSPLNGLWLNLKGISATQYTWYIWSFEDISDQELSTERAKYANFTDKTEFHLHDSLLIGKNVLVVKVKTLHPEATQNYFRFLREQEGEGCDIWVKDGTLPL